MTETFGKFKDDTSEEDEEETNEDEIDESAEGIDKRTLKVITLFLQVVSELPDGVLVTLIHALSSELTERQLHVSPLMGTLVKRIKALEYKSNIKLNDDDMTYWDVAGKDSQ